MAENHLQCHQSCCFVFLLCPIAVEDHCQSSATSLEFKTDCKIHIHDIYILS